MKLREIKNSKGEPTIEAEIRLGKSVGKASAPSGTSVGSYEAKFMPKKASVLIRNAERLLLPKIIGMNGSGQENFDFVLQEIDGTKNFSMLGGSVAISLSMAYAHACSNERKIPVYKGMKKSKRYFLPYPMGKCIGGGAHAKSLTSMQEFLSVPIGAKSLSEAIEVNRKMHSTVYNALKENFPTFKKKLDLEGGWIANVSDDYALGIMTGAAVHVTAETGVKVRVGIDVAGSNLYRNGRYRYGQDSKTTDSQLDYVLDLIDEYDLFYVEDAFREDDFRSFAELTRKAKDCLICGDDLFATNKARLEMGIKARACNSVLIKPNQAGTLTRAYDTIKLAHKKGYVPIVSHRSGETMDTTIASLAIAYNCPMIKIGIVGKEREAKLKELLRIEKTEKLRMNGEING